MPRQNAAKVAPLPIAPNPGYARRIQTSDRTRRSSTLQLRETTMMTRHLSRRSAIGTALAGLSWGAVAAAAEKREKEAPIKAKEPLKITKLETFLLKTR